MTEKGKYTKQEIFSQVKAWEDAICIVKKNEDQIKAFNLAKYEQVVFIGCGSTYYLSIAAEKIFQELSGVFCKAVPSGEMLMYPDSVYRQGENLVFAVSRSGETTETLEAVTEFKKRGGGDVICITNYPNRDLAKLSDLVIGIEEGQEKSIAQTRAFSSMFVALTAIALLLSNNTDLFQKLEGLPKVGNSLMEKYCEYSKKLGENPKFDRFYFLGSGFRYGLAGEASLKMKEMTLTHTEPFYFLEFRHGPKSMVNETTCIVGLLSESNRKYEEKVLQEMQTLGATVISVAEHDADIKFGSELPELVASILYLPLLQIMAFYRSIKKGLDPDYPRNLSTVVYLKTDEEN